MSKKKKKRKTRYNQYCKKHDQTYADYLRECPICVGERMGEMNKLGLQYWLRHTAIIHKKKKRRQK